MRLNDRATAFPGSLVGRMPPRWCGRFVAVALGVALLAAGLPETLLAGGTKPDPPADTPADRLYRRACGHVARRHLDLAYELLAESFGHGLVHPMKAVVDAELAPLLDDSVWRPRVRALIHRHAWDEEARMAASGEPGEHIVIVLHLQDEKDAPVSGAVVDLCQGDLKHPCASGTEWNPRLFASLRSGDSGRVAVETLLPDPATHGDGRHLHLKVERQGFEPCRGLILLDLAAGSGSEKGDGSSSCTVWTTRAGPPEEGQLTFRARLRLFRTP